MRLGTCRYIRATTVAVIITALCAIQSCSRSAPETVLDNYVTRVGRALSASVPAPEKITIPMRPRSAPPPQNQEPSIGLIAFVGLQRCQLQQIIAQRNSSLGKLAQPSQRLLNTVAFLRWVGPCIARLDSERDAKLIVRLKLAAQAKSAGLPALAWRAMLGSDEAQSFWQRSSKHRTYPASAKGGDTVNALAQMSQLAQAWLRGDYQQAGEGLESDLQQLSLGDGGQMLAAATLLQAQLQRANLLLEQRTAVGPICPDGRANGSGAILSNVVRLFLIAEVQPWSAALNRRYYALWPPLQQLEATLADGEPTAYRQWRQQRDALLQHHLSSPRRHAKRLQPILNACGLAPAR